LKETPLLSVPEQIATDRLILRRHKQEDLDAFAAFLADADATRYLAFTPEQKTRAGAAQMLDYVTSAYDTEAAVFSLTIADPETDEYLGSCGASSRGEEIEIYYTVVPPRQGEGIATEAARALVDHLRRDGQSGLVAYVVEENAASIAVARHLGFTDSGLVERHASTGDLQHEEMVGHKYVLAG
jgi:ribosomal-protein-alanine N-acetyltransferase